MANSILKLRRQAFSRQHCRCFYCAMPIWLSHKKSFALEHGIPCALARNLQCTAEHLRARQDGGQDKPANIAAACIWCNQQRHAVKRGPAPNSEAHKERVRRDVERGEWHPAAKYLARKCVSEV